MEDWTEKYRPGNLDEICGNERAITTLRNWAYKWKEGNVPKNRALVIVGKPGIGKTTSALALANDFGWMAVELNASDARNAAMIKRVATLGAVNETFDDYGRFIPSNRGGRKLIILDEADNLYENIEKTEKGGDFSDKGGKKAIVETIKITNQPIILIVNNYYNLIKGKGEILKQICTVVQYYEVNSNQIIELLKRICIEENISADIKLLRTIADRCKGDIRSAINDLQSICLNRKHVDIQSLDVLGYRDREKIIFDALRDVFKGRNIQSIKDSIYNIDVPPETFLLWLTENLPREYMDIIDMIKGYEAVSKADLFFGRVFKRQYYGLWSYACDIMNGGVSTAKNHNYGNVKYYPPIWIKEMMKSKTARGLRDSVVKKIGGLCHNSTNKSKEFLLPHFKYLFRNNTLFACKMKNKLDLSESEIKYLLGEKHIHKIKDILQLSEKTDEKQIEIKTSDSNNEEKEEDKKEGEQEIKQPSIFDF
ncbi:MAG: replication factor C large subunit [Thermoplasmatales archaeon]|nr:MAG: replication factor C large subunit [Thermoplasmatales archaeon]